jgi:hypothetical protein
VSPLTPSLSLNRQPRAVVNATPLHRHLSYDERQYGRHYLPLYQLEGERETQLIYVDLNSRRKQLTYVNTTQPVGLSCILNGSQ